MAKKEEDRVICPKCNGQGTVLHYTTMFSVKCETCNGKGSLMA
jgi:DnaJ-class molecular chaperone